MEFLIFIGIILAIVIFGKLARQGKLGNEIETSLKDHIRLNEMKAAMAGAEVKTGSVGTDDSGSSTYNPNQDYTGSTLQLMETILTDIGCQPKKDGENRLEVLYQGENFVVNTGGFFAQIWDPGWAHINVKDPNYENMKEATNRANFDFGPTIVWSAPNEEGWSMIHSKRDILVLPHIPDRNEYVKSILNSFFEKKETMRSQFNSLLNQKQEHKPKRPVGFATESEE